MKNLLLLPHRFQKVGWVILIPVSILGILMIIDGYNGVPTFFYPGRIMNVDNAAYQWLSSETTTHCLNNIVIAGIVIGGLLASCSKEKVEDEMISSVRLHSLLVALYVNYLLLIVGALCFYDLKFFEIMIWNMFTMLLIFLIVFRFNLWRLRKEAQDEK